MGRKAMHLPGDEEPTTNSASSISIATTRSMVLLYCQSTITVPLENRISDLITVCYNIKKSRLDLRFQSNEDGKSPTSNSENTNESGSFSLELELLSCSSWFPNYQTESDCVSKSV